MTTSMKPLTVRHSVGVQDVDGWLVACCPACGMRCLKSREGSVLGCEHLVEIAAMAGVFVYPVVALSLSWDR
jgi:hypothetical protein